MVQVTFALTLSRFPICLFRFFKPQPVWSLPIVNQIGSFLPGIGISASLRKPKFDTALILFSHQIVFSASIKLVSQNPCQVIKALLILVAAVLIV